MKEFFENGQTVLFQGDSVTDCLRDRSDDTSLGCGYPNKISEIYHSLFPLNNVTFLNKGVSGNRSTDLLERYDADFKAIQPDFISILIGINDCWRRYDANDPTSCEQFEKNYRTLLEKIKADIPHAKIMLIEPYVLPSVPGREEWHEDLDPKINVVHTLAREYADYFLPLNGIMNAASVCRYTCKELTEDGVHPSQVGHAVIADAYFKTLGIL